ncbi:MAG: thioesterase-like protein [Caldilinea sp. CFX5]|nr:thioesterase-like protein [Caldilinea sp. CFX5]
MNAPLTLYTDLVRPEWIDYNQHMMDGYYAVAFSHATDAFLDYIGLHAGYRAQSGCSTYTAEGHILFLRELKAASPLRFTTQLLGYDAKRMHIFHAMHHATEGFLAATCEWMMIHVDAAQGRGAAMPAEVLARLAAIQASHATLPTPSQAGRVISLQSKRS